MRFPNTDVRTHPLTMALQVAVPVLVAEVQALPPSSWPRLLADWRAESVPHICDRGDVLQYGSAGREKRGEAARAFVHLARGLAALSFHRGGAKVFGLVWCAEHFPGGKVPGEDWHGICRSCFLADPHGPGPDCPCCWAAVVTVDTGGLT